MLFLSCFMFSLFWLLTRLRMASSTPVNPLKRVGPLTPPHISGDDDTPPNYDTRWAVRPRGAAPALAPGLRRSTPPHPLSSFMKSKPNRHCRRQKQMQVSRTNSCWRFDKIYISYIYVIQVIQNIYSSYKTVKHELV